MTRGRSGEAPETVAPRFEPRNRAWLETVIASQDDRSRVSAHGDPLPAFPPVELQVATTSLGGRDTILPAFAFYEDVLSAADRCGMAWTADARVLDFGVGWGRIARLFLHEVRLRNLYGIDVDPAFTRMCADLFGTANFSTCSPLPPTGFAPATFSLVSAYSVLSHLAPGVAERWIGEFARIVRPGGLLAFTTRDVTFLDYCEALSRQATTGYPRALGELFPDFGAARARYARGEFLFATSTALSGGGPRNESFYGEAFIPQAYVEARWTKDFELVEARFDPVRYDQRAFVLRRR
jgi:SAM-dependent methyltransferase